MFLLENLLFLIEVSLVQWENGSHDTEKRTNIWLIPNAFKFLGL